MKKTFTFLELLIYICFIVLDFNGLNSTAIKYSGVVLCFLFSLYTNKRIQSLALFFTVVADLFLLVLNNYYEIGIISFIFVQIIYIYFQGNINNPYFNRFLIIRCLLFGAGCLTLIFMKNFSFLNVLVMFYFSNLFSNFLQSLTGNNVLFSIGLGLFVCCDICVGFYNLNVCTSLTSKLMWIFYLPSQVLIALA